MNRGILGLNIRRLELLNGARQATGTTIIIDVFRAFTTAAYVMANGAKEIIPVSTVEEAFKIRRLEPDWLLMGEVHGKKVPGFDYGNSPYEVSSVNFKDRTVVQRTSSGVQGILAASEATEILLGSFVMADAIVRYVEQTKPDIISIVSMGWEGEYEAIEDELCGQYLESSLRGLRPNFLDMVKKIKADESGARFFDKTQNDFVEGDFHAAMSLNKFDFVLKVERAPRMKITFA